MVLFQKVCAWTATVQTPLRFEVLMANAQISSLRTEEVEGGVLNQKMQHLQIFDVNLDMYMQTLLAFS